MPPSALSKKRTLQTMTTSSSAPYASGSQTPRQPLERPRKKQMLPTTQPNLDRSGHDPSQTVGVLPAKSGLVKQAGSKISDHPQDELMLLRSELAQKERELAAARKLIQEAGDSQVVKNTLERVKELVDCTVCFETLSNPFTVDPCGHEFCAGCLHDWFKDRRSKNEALECPMCRTRVERPPIRAIILRGVSDMLCDMDPPHSTHTVANDKEFWSELFPPTKPILSYHLQGLPQHQPLALTIPVPGLYIPSGWRLPPKIPPHRLPLDLSHFPNELIRRGASLRMIFHFGLQYSPEEGITCFLGRFHVHFGWFIFEWMTAWAERSDGLQNEMRMRPWMWLHCLGSNCVYRVERDL